MFTWAWPIPLYILPIKFAWIQDTIPYKIYFYTTKKDYKQSTVNWYLPSEHADPLTE